MYHEKIYIDSFVIKLIRDKQFRKQMYQEYLANCYELNLNKDFHCISPEVLRLTIQKARYSRKIRLMLPAILAFADNTSLTDENFQMLLRFRGKYRNTCLSAIGHLELSFYQMCILNRYPLGYEAFCWLFDKICCYDCFTAYDLLRLLEENSDVRVCAIRDCIRAAKETYGNSDKIEIAEKWIRELPKSSKHQNERVPIFDEELAKRKEDAKKLYFLNGANYFTMMRNGEYEEYRKYRISADTEYQWSQEIKKEYIAKITSGEDISLVLELSKINLPKAEILDAFQKLASAPNAVEILATIKMLNKLFEDVVFYNQITALFPNMELR